MVVHISDKKKNYSKVTKLLVKPINNVLDMARVESGKMELDENYEVVGNIT